MVLINATNLAKILDNIHFPQEKFLVYMKVSIHYEYLVLIISHNLLCKLIDN